MHFLPYSIYGEMIESIGRLEVDAYCGELAFLYQMLENVEYNKFKISVRASVALTKLAKHSDNSLNLHQTSKLPH